MMCDDCDKDMSGRVREQKHLAQETIRFKKFCPTVTICAEDIVFNPGGEDLIDNIREALALREASAFLGINFILRRPSLPPRYYNPDSLRFC